MASLNLKDIFNTLKNKAETIFYEQSDVENGYNYAAAPQENGNPYENPYTEQGNAFEQGYQQNTWQQPQQNMYQQPMQEMQQMQQMQQNTWQQPQQNMYQQPMQQMQQMHQNTWQQPQQSMYQQPMQQNTWQQPQQNMYQQQPAENAQPQQQENPNVVPFPNAQQQTENNAPACCVINARNVSECYSAIVQLRSGSMVIVVLENINDTMEMRHYVDMLSGACYALKGTITKLSRHGAYLIAPNHMRVCVDAATNQFNSPASRMQRPQSPLQQQMPQQMQQMQEKPWQRPMQQSEQMNNMYARPISPDAGMAPNQARQPFNGHVTDMPMENVL